MLLRGLQRGERLGMPHSRPMPDVGKGCHELRIVDQTRAWRIIYAVRADAVVILDVFPKTTRTTPASILQICRRRLSQYESAVQGKERKP